MVSKFIVHVPDTQTAVGLVATALAAGSESEEIDRKEPKSVIRIFFTEEVYLSIDI